MKTASLVALGGITLLGAVVWLSRPAAAPSGPRAQASTPTAPAIVETSAAVRWIAAAGGELPEFNQISIEQDLGLAQQTFGEGGYTLFAAGAGRPVVQVLGPPSLAPDDPTTRLAELFAPRGGRDATYQAPQIEVQAPATAHLVAQTIRAAVAHDDEPLLIYLAGHGHQGPTPAENAVGFWGQSSLAALDFAELLADSQRQVRVVATTCFSGGLAELAFADADAQRGPTEVPVCGLFAAPFDLEASGCDPNPDRAAQEGFGLHFLNALQGRARDGELLPADRFDFDGDGRISLREAHARVRIASAAPDVPTSTSERWLEAVAPGPGSPTGRVTMPEEDAVIAALGRSLGLVDQLERARLHLTKLEHQIDALGRRLQQTQDAEDRAYRAAAADVLARWPVLDDPWHPSFGAQLASNIDAIREHFDTSPTYRTYLEARAEADGLSTEVFDLRAKAAPYERLARALEYRQRARRLAAVGGEDWEFFEALRACEASAPPR